MSYSNVEGERIRRRIKSVYIQISEIDMAHNDFGTPDRLDVIHNSLNEILSECEGLENRPPIIELDTKGHTSKAYQQLKSDILKLVAIFNVDISDSMKSSEKTQQINVNVIQSNVQNMNISDIKKEEIKKLFAQLEETAKSNSLDEKTQNSKLRTLLGEIVNLSLDAGTMGLRWANENGLIRKIFGS